MEAYYNDGRGRYSTGESYDWFYKYDEDEEPEIGELLTSAKLSKNNIIELDKVKDKIKQQELVVNCEEEIEYEQLLDLAVGVFELKPADDLKRRIK